MTAAPFMLAAGAELDRLDTAAIDIVNTSGRRPAVRERVEDLRDAVASLVEAAEASDDPALGARAARVRRRLAATRRAMHSSSRDEGAPGALAQSSQFCDAGEVAAYAVASADAQSVEYRAPESTELVSVPAAAVQTVTRVIVEALAADSAREAVVWVEPAKDGLVTLSATTKADVPIADLSRAVGRVHELLSARGAGTEPCRISMSGPDLALRLPMVRANVGAAGTSISAYLKAA